MGKQEEQGSALPLEELFDATAVERADEAVIDYLRDLLAIYLSDGSLEGEPAEVAALAAHCENFLPLNHANFFQCILRLQGDLQPAKFSATGLNLSTARPGTVNRGEERIARTEEGKGFSDNARQRTGDADGQFGGRDMLSASAGKQKRNSGPRRRRRGKRTGVSGFDERAGSESPCSQEEQSAGGEAGHAPIVDTCDGEGNGKWPSDSFHELMVAVCGEAGAVDVEDTTVMEYLCASVEDCVKCDEEADEIYSLVVGVVPALEQVFEADWNSESFARFLAAARRVNELQEDNALTKKRRAEAEAAARLDQQHSIAVDSVDQQVGVAERRAQEEASKREREDAAEALSGNEQAGPLGQLQELFPGVRPRHLRGTYAQSGGDLAEAIEKLMGQLELEAGALSEETVRAQAVADEQEFKEKMRLRAITRYNVGTEAEKQESGKKVQVHEGRREELEKEVKRQWASGGPKQRYIDNQVVAHKGERTIYVKTKNAVPDPKDPKTMVSLKILSKRRGGPSPNFNASVVVGTKEQSSENPSVRSCTWWPIT